MSYEEHSSTMTSRTNAEGILKQAVDQLVIERNALRAEVEFLQKEVQRARAALMDFEKTKRERDELRAQADGFNNEVQMLRAEREVWGNIAQERNELRAEVVRLDDLADDRLADNERLRAALDKHHDLLSDEPGDCCQTCGLDYLANAKEC
jgi:uncharacterized coiled-coil DUF342 family protein